MHNVALFSFSIEEKSSSAKRKRRKKPEIWSRTGMFMFNLAKPFAFSSTWWAAQTVAALDAVDDFQINSIYQIYSMEIYPFCQDFSALLGSSSSNHKIDIVLRWISLRMFMQIENYRAGRGKQRAAKARSHEGFGFQGLSSSYCLVSKNYADNQLGYLHPTRILPITKSWLMSFGLGNAKCEPIPAR